MRRVLIITVLFLLPGIYLAAQQFPVQVTPQLLPPYTLQASEYYSPGAAGNKLNLLLLLRDFNKPVLQVRLRMSIEGQNVSIRTREDAVFTPLTIESGIPKYVEPSELAQYFNSNNLEFSGLTQQQYQQTGKFPEGFYTFCFEVIETGANQVVSNKGCSFAWMTLNEPPLLNIPRRAEALIPVTPQNILFQWTPRHTASPTAAFNTDYVFSIVELQDEAIAPEAAFLSNPPLYVDSTNLTTYLYDLTKPSLIAGKKYAWRVQAKAKNGLEDMAMFRNNGYSETFWFTYQNNCAVPVGIAASPQGQRVGITWTNNVEHLEYKVEYREKNDPDAVWFEIGNTIPRVSITDLKPGTLYEYRVGGACEYGRFIFASMQQFTTNGSTATTVPDCGVDPNLTGPQEPLLQQLNPGDTIKAGDFDVVTTQVTGQTSFSGQGYVAVSWLANMKLAVRFTNIGVTTDKKLKTGVIETTYDPTEGGIADVDEIIEMLGAIVNELSATIQNLIKVLQGNNIADDPQKIVNYAYDVITHTSDKIPDEVLKDIVEKTKELEIAKDAMKDAKSDEEKVQAEEKFKAAADNLAKSWNDFLTLYTSILKDAVKKYYNEKKPQEATIIANYQNLLNSVNQNNTAPVTNDDIIIHEIITVDTVSTSSLDPTTLTLLNNFTNAEKEYIMYHFAKILSDEANSNELLEKFVEKAKSFTIDFTNEIKKGLDRKDQKNVIVDNIKAMVIQSFTKIIEDITK